MRPGGFTEKVVRQLVLNLLGPRAPGIAVPENAIPGMRIRAISPTIPCRLFSAWKDSPPQQDSPQSATRPPRKGDQKGPPRDLPAPDEA